MHILVREGAWSGLTGQGSGLTGQGRPLACQAGWPLAAIEVSHPSSNINTSRTLVMSSMQPYTKSVPMWQAIMNDRIVLLVMANPNPNPKSIRYGM